MVGVVVVVVVVVVVLLLLLLLVGDTFVLSVLWSLQKNLYKNKSVDNSDIRYCVKFQPFLTSVFAKNRQKRFNDFWRFCVFCLFDLENDVKIQI